jgi:ribosomal protein S27AE
LEENILSWEDSIFLEEGEKIVTSWRGDREMTQKVGVSGQYGTTMQDVKERKNGFLVLTNQRLLFLEEHGVFGKSYHQVLGMQLLKLQSISMGGILIPFVSIADDMGSHIFHIDGVGKNEFESFRQLIMDHCRKRREEIEAEKKKERVQVLLDFSSLKDYMEKGGLILQKTKCPECGAPMALPTTGNQTKCEHCGSVVYAQDIFEKVKSLIG